MDCLKKDCDMHDETTLWSCKKHTDAMLECKDYLMAQAEPVTEVPCSAGVIKPCPFCGSDAEWHEDPELSKGWGYYFCLICHARRFPNASNKREGGILWNKRAL